MNATITAICDLQQSKEIIINIQSDVKTWTDIIWVTGISEHTASVFTSSALKMEAYVAQQHWYPHDYELGQT
jgi:hypothetical protein